MFRDQALDKYRSNEGFHKVLKERRKKSLENKPLEMDEHTNKPDLDKDNHRHERIVRRFRMKGYMRCCDRRCRFRGRSY